jgi:hypothetical protein
MFMPDHFLNVYVEHFSPIASKHLTGIGYKLDVDTNYKQIKNCLEMTEEQWTPYWNNIVEVFANIQTHKENFHMQDWHCETSHCLAGWAQYLFRHDNYVKWLYGTGSSVFLDGEKLLSPVISAFFLFSRSTDEIYNHLILPVLEEARKDGMIPLKTQNLVSVS